ncbi:hypothetical protein LZ30DRAFT_714085 [Colletotrichum cereale]|nr:hypothetical protein LZ30DRAFT_714085 [Colletotrichum cereale]
MQGVKALLSISFFAGSPLFEMSTTGIALFVRSGVRIQRNVCRARLVEDSSWLSLWLVFFLFFSPSFLPLSVFPPPRTVLSKQNLTPVPEPLGSSDTVPCNPSVIGRDKRQRVTESAIVCAARGSVADTPNLLVVLVGALFARRWL